MRSSIILILFTLLFACQTPNPKENQTTIEIPKLLDRHTDLQQGKEWEGVQSQYVKNRDEANTEDEAKLNLAYLFINEARITGEHGHYYPAALKMIEVILENQNLEKDLKFRALAAKASVQLSLHDFNNALETGKLAVAINPYNAQIFGVLVDAYVELGDYEKAVKMADQMVTIRPDLRSYARVSYLREIHGDWGGAIEAMKMAVAAGYPTYEQSAWARLTLGNLLKEYGEIEHAKAQYEQILQDRPDYPFALAALAEIAIENEQYKKAETLLKKACKSIPEVGFYVQLAKIYQAINQKEQFETTTKEILAMLQDDVDHGHNMDLEYVEVYAELINDQETALSYAQKAYKERPENIDVNQKLAEIYLNMGQRENAQIHIQKAGKTKSQRPDYLMLKQQLARL